jgi:glycosyltransferase involved in cell wall biosynthesis
MRIVDQTKIRRVVGLLKRQIEVGRARYQRWRRLQIKSVLFIGYAEAALGLGVSFRALLTALDQASSKFSIYPFNVNVHTRLIGPFLQNRYDLTGCYEINVAYMAIDQLPYLYEALNYQILGARYNILRTYWELPKVPEEWSRYLEPINELWVPNSFVASAFRAVHKGKISTIPVPIDVSRTSVYDRAHFKLSETIFYFLFTFDYYSGAARKNPLGVIRAFTKAFPNPNRKVGLVIKCVGPTDADPDLSQQLAKAPDDDERIRMIHTTMARDEVLSLIEQCDCYVSLHRSEGFGMGMAEALAFGRPVIGTDFSGNQEFLTAETGFPVSCALRKLAPGEYLGGENQYWAEPDLDAAAEQMRRVFADPEEGWRHGTAGRNLIASRYSGDVVARAVQARLAEIKSELDR